jgi:hypothetical protein
LKASRAVEAKKIAQEKAAEPFSRAEEKELLAQEKAAERVSLKEEKDRLAQEKANVKESRAEKRARLATEKAAAIEVKEKARVALEAEELQDEPEAGYSPPSSSLYQQAPRSKEELDAIFGQGKRFINNAKVDTTRAEEADKESLESNMEQANDARVTLRVPWSKPLNEGEILLDNRTTRFVIDDEEVDETSTTEPDDDLEMPPMAPGRIQRESRNNSRKVDIHSTDDWLSEDIGGDEPAKPIRQGTRAASEKAPILNSCLIRKEMFDQWMRRKEEELRDGCSLTSNINRNCFRMC